MKFLPLMLNIEGKIAVVFGMNNLTEKRVFQFLDAGATVNVIAYTADTWKNFTGKEAVEIEQALENAVLCTVHTGNRDLDSFIAAKCRKKGIPCNVIDSTTGSAIFPACRRSGEIVVSISTSGSVPSLSSFLSDRLIEDISMFSQGIPVLSGIRKEIKGDMGTKSRIMRKIITNSTFWNFIMEGNYREAHKIAKDILNENINAIEKTE